MKNKDLLSAVNNVRRSQGGTERAVRAFGPGKEIGGLGAAGADDHPGRPDDPEAMKEHGAMPHYCYDCFAW